LHGGTFVSSRTEAVIAAVLIVGSGSACGDPFGPCNDQHGRGNNHPNRIIQTCWPVGPNLQCTAAPGYAQYAYCPQPLPPLVWTSSNSSVATVSPDRFVQVLARGEVDITVAARSAYLSQQTWSALVDPGQPPQVLYFLSGIIRENDGSDTRIPGGRSKFSMASKRNSDENRVDAARGFSVAGLARRAAGQPTVLAGVRRQPAADVIGSNRQYDTLRIVTINHTCVQIAPRW
jgi:hypothetical protein